MTLLAEQLVRIRDILQDTDISTTNISNIVTAHQEVMQQLARLDAFPQIQWVHAIAYQGLYLLPNPVVSINHVLYNQRVLRFASEHMLDRKYHGWEDLPGEPKYWITDNQAPNTIRIIPAPQRTGRSIPVIPSPLFQDMIDNFVIFHTEDLSPDIGDKSDTLPTLFDWDDYLVYETAVALAARETPHQNLPVVALCQKLSGMWKQYLKI